MSHNLISGSPQVILPPRPQKPSTEVLGFFISTKLKLALCYRGNKKDINAAFRALVEHRPRIRINVVNPLEKEVKSKD